MKYISPKKAADAVITVLQLAEMWQQWDLYKALLRYVEESGGKLARLPGGLYALELPEDEP